MGWRTMEVCVWLIEPFPLRYRPLDGEAWGQYNGGISIGTYDVAAAASLAHTHVQPLPSPLTIRYQLMTNTATKTHIPPLPSPYPLVSFPHQGRRPDIQNSRRQRCCRAAFQSRSKAGIFRSRSKAVKCSPYWEAIVPMAGMWVLLPYWKARECDMGTAKLPSLVDVVASRWEKDSFTSYFRKARFHQADVARLPRSRDLS